MNTRDYQWEIVLEGGPALMANTLAFLRQQRDQIDGRSPSWYVADRLIKACEGATAHVS